METVGYCLKVGYIDETGETKIGYVAEPINYNYERIPHIQIITKFCPNEIVFFYKKADAKLRVSEIKNALEKHYIIFSMSIHEIYVKN